MLNLTNFSEVKQIACGQTLCLGKGEKIWENLSGERVKKSRGEGMERVRDCRQTLGTAMPPSCLVIADHLSARSLSVTRIHWYVINIASKKGVGRNTQTLPRAKMLLFPMSFFSGGQVMFRRV